MKNLQKGFVVPLLIAIIAVLVVGGGVYVYNNNKKAEIQDLPADTEIQTTNQVQQQTNTKTPPANTQTNNLNSQSETLNWKIYSGVNFSFKYPPDWYMNISSPGSINITNYDPSFYETHGSDAPLSKENIAIHISTFTNLSANETIESWVNKLGLSDKRNILVDGVKALRGKIIYTGQEESGYYKKGESSGDYVIFIYNGKGYQIVYSPYGSKLVSTFEQILSTFKFTLPSAVSGWQTYTSTQYGFSVQYPVGSQINDEGSDGEGSNNVLFTLPKTSDTQGIKMFIVNMATKAWYNISTPNGVLKSPPNCNDFNSNNVVTSSVNINGIDFIKGDVSSAATAQRSSATEYCVLRGKTAYKLNPLIEYSRDNTTSIDVNKDSVLNQMVSTFKFTQ